MKHWTPLAAILVATVGFAAPPAAAARSKCAAAKSRTLMATEKVRLFGKGDLLFACARRSGRKFPLTSTEPGVDGHGPFALAGTYVAYGHYPACGVCVDEDSFVRVLNAATGRERSWRLDFDDDGKVVRVTDLVLDARGRAAWISRDRRTPADIQVQTQSATQEPLILDAGPEIARTSLALSGATLYWTRAGAPRSATLP